MPMDWKHSTGSRSDFGDSQVIILTAHDSLNNAIESIKRGAFHFISKPYAPEELLSLVEQALEKRSLLRETKALREKTERLEKRLEIGGDAARAGIQKQGDAGNRGVDRRDGAVGRQRAYHRRERCRQGSGRECDSLQSRRAGKPMVKLNCAAFPQTMIESELFGYVKGAFTGAMNDFPGMIAEASGGTLFLDEISEMPADLQTRFLRVLQEREYRSLGSTRTLKADFRVITATNRPIAASAGRKSTALRFVLPNQYFPD